MDITLAVEELAISGGISLGKRSRSTVYRWTKAINEYLKVNKYEYRCSSWCISTLLLVKRTI